MTVLERLLALSSHIHTTKARQTNLPTAAVTPFTSGAHPHFNLNYSHNTVAKRKDGTSSFQKHTMLKLYQNAEGNCQANTKGSPLTFLLHFSHHIPLLRHSPSTVRERLQLHFLKRPTLVLSEELLRSWYSEHSERGEPSESGLPHFFTEKVH